MFDTRSLKIFLAVARRGSFSRAATEVHLTQSSVSDHIQALEIDLGTALFTRSHRGAALTSAGAAFAAYAEDLLILAGEARTAVAVAAAQSGPLTVGTLETIAAARLPTGLAAFCLANPDIELKLKVAGSGELLLALERGEIDLAICFPRETTSARFVNRPLARESLVLVGSSSCHREFADLAALAAERFISTAPGCIYRHLLDTAFTEAGYAPPKPAAEVASLTAVIRMAAAGAGLALVPGFAVTEEVETGRLAEYTWPGPLPEAALTMIWRRQRAQLPALRRFLVMAREGVFVKSNDGRLRHAGPSPL